MSKWETNFFILVPPPLKSERKNAKVRAAAAAAATAALDVTADMCMGCGYEGMEGGLMQQM